jgi:beta-phosphoglucomutase family hydrolase
VTRLPERVCLPPSVHACLFDLDGVLTRTAEIHAAAWKQMFDAYLKERTWHAGEALAPFDAVADYERFVDGRPRADGVGAFLESRAIVLPAGGADDPPSAETIYGLANRKNDLLRGMIRERGVRAYEGSVRFVRAALAGGLACAVVTSSENAEEVLMAADLGGLFDAQVDGRLIRERGLAGKPAPDAFLEAARVLGVPPVEAAVFEDALAGVQAGRAGGFGLVVGVDRTAGGPALVAAGADLVLQDLAELLSK